MSEQNKKHGYIDEIIFCKMRRKMFVLYQILTSRLQITTLLFGIATIKECLSLLVDGRHYISERFYSFYFYIITYL